jgi:excisionase family DNA binding protein
MSSEISSAAAAPKQSCIDHGPITYDPESAEKATGRPKSRIRRAIKNGELVARRDGRRLLIEAEELRRWIRSLPLAASR